ncbi:tRNA-ribosyltransferase family protein, partial [Pseudomonas chlororaphis]|uniref:tRNA-ribosyltransferase family protein n=1 Tax=Pseudomonas chlororaphis TaxID=587753 RepID=UPI0021CC66ED
MTSNKLERYIGPDERSKFSLERFFRWRCWWDYSTGLSGDLLTHEYDAVNQIMHVGIPHSATSSVGVYFFKDGRTVPDVLQTTFEWPDRDLTMLYSATLASSRNRAKVFMGPEESMQVQRDLGSDVVMIFDECTPYPADEDVARVSMELSLRWAQRSKNAHGDNTAALFGIVQGGMHQNLRERSLEGLNKIGFDGLAIGGLSVGEPKHEMIKVLDYLPAMMPADKPRYLMGVGKPEDLVEGVRRGVDMFDCVMPTRNARNGHLFIDT